jgi:hypothetical protein
MYSEFFARCVSCDVCVPEELYDLYIHDLDVHVCKECVIYEPFGKYLLMYVIRKYYTFGKNLFEKVSSNIRGLYSKPDP